MAGKFAGYRIKFLKKYHRFFDIMGGIITNCWLLLATACPLLVFSFQYYLVIHLLLPALPFAPMMLTVFVFIFIQSAMPSLDLLGYRCTQFYRHAFIFIYYQPANSYNCSGILYLAN
jgi:Na+/glutamate symporter